MNQPWIECANEVAPRLRVGAARIVSLGFAGLLAAGCASNGTPGGTSTSSSAALGGPVLGIPDTHCWQPAPPDGGLNFLAQPVHASSCYVTDGGLAFDEDAGLGSDYGPTEWNVSGNDDDCKYFVGWHSTPISVGQPVTFWVSAQYATSGAPLTGLGASASAPEIYLEVAGAADGGIGNHVSPTISGAGVPIEETPVGSGIYQIGPAVFFDESGLWYIRFHFNENCDDILSDSPHGHAAFYVNLP